MPPEAADVVPAAAAPGAAAPAAAAAAGGNESRCGLQEEGMEEEGGTADDPEAALATFPSHPALLNEMRAMPKTVAWS